MYRGGDGSIYATVIVLALVSVLSTLCGIAVPLLQKLFIQSLSEFGPQALARLLLILGSLTLAFFVGSALLEWGKLKALWLGLLSHRFLTRKVLTLIHQTPVSEWQQSPHKSILSHLSQDISAINTFFEEALMLLSGALLPMLAAPFVLAAVTHIAVSQTLLVLVPGLLVLGLIAGRHARLFLRLKNDGDARLRLVEEYLQLYRGLALIHWRKFFVERIKKQKDTEAAGRFIMAVNGTLMNILSLLAPSLLNMATLYWIILRNGQSLDSGTLLASYWICSIFLLRPYRTLPVAILLSLDAYTSWRRMKACFAAFAVLNREHNSPAVIQEVRATPAILPHSVKRNQQQILATSKIVLQACSLNVITGGSGSGKSVLLEDLATGLEKSIGWAQERPFFFRGTVFENIGVGNTNLKSDPRAIDQLLSQFKLDALIPSDRAEIEDAGENLSGGMKQRVAIIRALVQGKVVLLDNALSALDPDTYDLTLTILKQRAKAGQLIILASNDARAIDAADLVISLDQVGIKG